MGIETSLWCFCFWTIQLYQRQVLYAFLIAYIIEFSMNNTPFGVGIISKLINTFPICRTIQYRQTGLNSSEDVRACA